MTYSLVSELLKRKNPPFAICFGINTDFVSEAALIFQVFVLLVKKKLGVFFLCPLPYIEPMLVYKIVHELTLSQFFFVPYFSGKNLVHQKTRFVGFHFWNEKKSIPETLHC